MFRVIMAALLVMPAVACRKPSQSVEPEWPPASPAACHQRMVKAAQGKAWAEVFDLIHRDSRWSLISWHTALKEVCRLVRAHYPESRRARALQRCKEAARYKEARDYFAAGGGRLAPLDQLARAGKITSKEGGDGKVTLAAGGAAYVYCPGKDGWGYCGLAEAFRQLKIKSARDLASVQENVEAYARQR